MTSAQITKTLFDKLIADYNGYPIKFPVGNVFDRGLTPYIEPHVEINTPVRIIGGFRIDGIMTVNLYYQDRMGDLFGKTEAQAIADVFPDGSTFGGIEISEIPHIGKYLDNGDGWWFTPVTVTFTTKECS